MVDSMKRIFLPVVAAAILLCGCSTVKQITPKLVQQGTEAVVRFGVSRYPQAEPEVRIAGDVICSVANGTDLSPSNIVAQVKIIEPNLSPEGSLIINGGIMLYQGIWNSFGADAVNGNEQLKAYLQATCLGFTYGLPSQLPRAYNPAWPMVR